MNSVKQIMVVVAGIAVFAFIALCGLLGFAGMSSIASNIPFPGSCETTVATWVNDSTEVIRDLTSSAEQGGNADFSAGIRYVVSAKNKYNSMTPPSCDEDAMNMHNSMKQVLNLTHESLQDANSGNYASATSKARIASELANDWPNTISILERRYIK